MKKFINKPENIVTELLQGFALSSPDKIRLAGSNLVARAVPKAKGKVGVVTLGGSGHEPGLSGFVGEGMLDVSVAGEIFAAPELGEPVVHRFDDRHDSVAAVAHQVADFFFFHRLRGFAGAMNQLHVERNERISWIAHQQNDARTD